MDEASTYTNRLRELIDLKRHEKVDAIIVYSDVWRCGNTQYFTGWWPTGGGISQSSVFLIVKPDDGFSMLVGFEQINDARPRIPSVEVASSDELSQSLDAIRPRPRRVGLVGINILPATYMALLRNVLGNVEFVDLTSKIIQWRRVKTAWELDRLRVAAACSDKAIVAAVNALKRGVSEETIMAAGLQAISCEGGIPSFLPVVGFGMNSAIPMSFPHFATILEGASLILLDFGARLRGYAGDVSRTVLAGSVSETEREIVRVAIQANKHATEIIKPGIHSCEVNEQVKKTIREAGMGEFIVHDSTHGVGIDHEEDFPLEVGNDVELKENMVFTIEAGIYVSGLGGARIEDVVTVTRTGSEVLNRLPHEIVKYLS